MPDSPPDQNKSQDAEPQRGRKRNRAQALFHKALGKGPRFDAEFGDSEVGRLLCATRMRLGKDLQQIAQILHIRYNYLVAIEDGRYEDLPGQAYAIGFVRAYADHLELDGDEIVRRFKEDSTGLKRKAALEFTVPTPDSGVPSGLALLAAIALGMAIYGIWYGLSGLGRQSAPVVQEVPARLQPPADQPAGDAAASPDGTAPVTGDAATGAPAAATPDSSSPMPAGTAAPEASPPQAAPVAGQAPAGAPGVTPTNDTVGPPAPSGNVIEVRAKADSWIQVREGEAIILTRFLHKGESYTAPDRPNISLMTANAGGIEILLNGEATPPLGDNGVVVSGVILDAAHLQSGD